MRATYQAGSLVEYCCTLSMAGPDKEMQNNKRVLLNRFWKEPYMDHRQRDSEMQNNFIKWLLSCSSRLQYLFPSLLSRIQLSHIIAKYDSFVG